MLTAKTTSSTRLPASTSGKLKALNMRYSIFVSDGEDVLAVTVIRSLI